MHTAYTCIFYPIKCCNTLPHIFLHCWCVSSTSIWQFQAFPPFQPKFHTDSTRSGIKERRCGNHIHGLKRVQFSKLMIKWYIYILNMYIIYIYIVYYIIYIIYITCSPEWNQLTNHGQPQVVDFYGSYPSVWDTGNWRFWPVHPAVQPCSVRTAVIWCSADVFLQNKTCNCLGRRQTVIHTTNFAKYPLVN